MSTSDVVESIRGARERRVPLRIQGAGTWLDAAHPVRAAQTLSLASDRGIVEYVPGDLTLTARAGTTFAELDEATRRNGQWLPLAPWGSASATLGATVSTATAGPYAAAFGLPRDAALGLEFVTGVGDVVRSGGRVVKNVAGFDLTRLLTGSWGTLGAITEITVRLRALPPRSRTLAITVDDSPSGLASLGSQVRALPFAPFVCELLNGALARRLGLAEGPTLLLELGGNVTSLAAQLDALRPLGYMTDLGAGAIDDLRNADSGAAASWRISARPARFADLWTLASKAGEGLVHGSISRGVVRVINLQAGMPAAPSDGMSVVIEKGARAERRRESDPRDHLAERIRAKFDPDEILNPGILGGRLA